MVKKPVSTERDDRGFRRTIAIGGAIILLMLIIGGYLFAREFLVPRPPEIPGGFIPVEPGASATPQEEYLLSPLVSEFGVTSAPVLIFNCQYKRIGTYASREKRGEVPSGTERQDLINALCRVSPGSAMCAYSNGTVQGTLTSLRNPVSCTGEGGKAIVYAFYSPSCANSANQRPILEELESIFINELEVIYVCTPVFDGDLRYCESQVRAGAYDE